MQIPSDDLEMSWGDEPARPAPAKPAVPVRNDRSGLFVAVAGVLVICALAFTTMLWRSRAVDAGETVTLLRSELTLKSTALATEYDRTSQLQTALYTTSLIRAGQAVEIRALEESVTALSGELKKLKGTKTRPVPPASPTVASPIRAQASSGVEQWRPLVTRYFKGNADAALRVMTGESHGDPRAANGPCWGLFQIDHEVHAAKIAEKARAWGMKADLFDPEFNIRFAAYMTAYGEDWSGWSVQP